MWCGDLPSSSSPVRCTTRVGRPARSPRRTVSLKSRLRRSRALLGSTLNRTTSGGELGATLAATSRQDPTARARAHPQPEPVGLGAPAIIRLIGALAHRSAPNRRGAGRTRPDCDGPACAGPETLTTATGAGQRAAAPSGSTRGNAPPKANALDERGHTATTDTSQTSHPRQSKVRVIASKGQTAGLGLRILPHFFGAKLDTLPHFRPLRLLRHADEFEGS